MALEIKMLETPDEDWDKRVLENNGAIYQTTTYAAVQEQALGMKMLYLVALHNSEIVGQLIVNVAPLFYKYLKDKREKLLPFFWKHFKTYMFVRGPVILDTKLESQIYDAILDHLERLVRKDGFMLHDLSLPVDKGSFCEPFLERNFHVDSWGTVLVDLTKPEEELWKNLKKSRRNLVNNGTRRGLVVKEAKTKKDFDLVIGIIQNMSKRNNILAYEPKYYQTLFKILADKDMVRTFYIEQDGRGIATISVYIFGKQLIQTLVAHTDYGMKEKIYGIDFLEWFILKWGRENDYSTYDLAGIRPDSKDKKDVGLREYKMRWGGEVIRYNYFSKHYSFTKNVLASTIKFIAKRFVA